MPFLGVQPSRGLVGTAGIDADAITAAKIADDQINSEHYVAASIDNEHLADDAVGVAELSATGTASSSTFLRGDNSWAAAGGGAWTLVDMTNVTSATSAVTVTGLDNSTYNTYCITIANLVPETDNRGLRMRLGDSGGLKTGASDYAWVHSNIDQAGNESNISDSSDSFVPIVNTTDWVGSSTGEGYSAVIYLHISTSSGPVDPMFHGTHCAKDQSRAHHAGWLSGSTVGMYPITQFSIYASSGNIDNGRVSTYGIKHT